MNFWEEPIIGIYKITHRITGKAYIGQSIDILNERWKSHINFAQDKKKWQVIKKALYKHGITKFTFEVLEECSKEDLNDREIYWISYFNTVSPAGYNLTSGGGGLQNPSEETRKKLSEAKSKPCIITIDGISNEYESVTIAAKILGKVKAQISEYIAGEASWPTGWSGNFKGEAPNIYTKGKQGRPTKSRPFFLKGVLYTCSQKEAIEKSGFPYTQEYLSRVLNGRRNWPGDWYGHFEGEEPKECPRTITPGRKKK